MTDTNSSNFTIEYWEIEKVEAMTADYNPRAISTRMMTALENSIEEFGMLLPIVVNTRTNRVVGGHQRLKAAREKSLPTVPVHLIDLDEYDEKRLNLALNKIEGKWDFQVLEEMLTELSKSDAIALSGFSEADLVEIMSDADSGSFNETFEEFVERQSLKTIQPIVTFRSPSVYFSCPKTSYEALIHELYSQVGVSDWAASIEFFRRIGLD